MTDEQFPQPDDLRELVSMLASAKSPDTEAEPKWIVGRKVANRLAKLTDESGAFMWDPATGLMLGYVVEVWPVESERVYLHWGGPGDAKPQW